MRYLFRTFLFVAVFAGFVPGVFGATVIFTKDFETGDLSNLKPHTVGGTVRAVTNPVAAGRYSGQYDLIRILGVDTYRAETYLDNITPNTFDFGVEYWFGLNYLRTDWAVDSDAEIGPIQLHRVPSQWATPVKPGEQRVNVCGGERPAMTNAPFLMASSNNEERIVTLGGVHSWKAPIVTNKWSNIVFHFKITGGDQPDASSGYVEAWKDGVYLFKRNGALYTNRNDECGQPWKPSTYNMGIYKWNWWAGNSKPTQSSRRTLYIDDLKIAKGADGYNQVSATAPKTPIPPTPTPGPTPPPLPPGDGITLTIYRGQSATLRWNSTTASSCQGSGGWSGSLAISGTQSVSPTNSTDYTLACRNAIGVTTKTVHVIVVAP